MFDAILWTVTITMVSASSYLNTMAIFKDKLGSDNYHTEVRPVLNQSTVLSVWVSFQVVAIVKVDEISQSFICNGFVYFIWRDEIVAWNPYDYGGQFLIHPLPENIWRPRVILRNTLGDRDLFDDDKAPLFVGYDGTVNWVPGSLFPSSCELNMYNYPFDVQTCAIRFVAMSLTIEEMMFYSPPGSKVGTDYFTSNGEWELIDSNATLYNLSAGGVYLSAVDFNFVLRRRPYFLLLNIVLPVVFLSFLNILVFTIPVESGEKIGYGITVLLALSVFMSIISSMLPRSASLPRVTVYLFILLALSVLTVVDSIIIVYIYHKEEKESKHMRSKGTFRVAFSKVRHFHRAVAPVDMISTGTNKTEKGPDVHITSDVSQPPAYLCPDEDYLRTSVRNKYKLIGKYIDVVSFVLFFIIWLAVTLGFMLEIAL